MKVTIKQVLRGLSLLAIIFVFCPSFLVSCSGKHVPVSVMTTVWGVKAYGEYVFRPQPIMLICLILPVISLVVLFIKKFADKNSAIVILGCTAADLIMWLIFCFAVKKYVEDNYCSFRITPFLIINIILLLLIISLTVLIVMSKLQMDMDLIELFSGGAAQEMFDQMSDKVSQISGSAVQLVGNVANNINSGNAKKNIIGFCSECGAPIEYGCKFCTKCGAMVPESMIEKAENVRRSAEKEAKQEAAQDTGSSEKKSTDHPMVCRTCGAKLEPDSIFCESCGTKVEQ